MPQVDVVSFFPQVFWLILLLITTYIYLLRYSVYSLINIFKIRFFFYLNNRKNSSNNSIQNKIVSLETMSTSETLINSLVLNNKKNLIETYNSWSNINLENEILTSNIAAIFQDCKLEQVCNELTLLETN